ncbi:ATP-dependent zinc metalloprotease FtsH [Auxenochlorella protothecoides]|uniref:ATP-dependent zinc metalloprotease FtsH n=2 Tax=Auxenochlorella protothecoides TaxID=3075 RepID=A0A087SSP2_AUXPR|nr:ATP-dependent zinc metalloprotease FtsH [Auxenochlorella protothecoides]KFM28746.1 ATP-dependent zinc metalloprotease FtsH [Auxenochlorella protothecoides]RMZ55491.1 hypothetical protein APUTEX25_000074 [Auxenochlorella protothecoides]|eukprot:RMZ55491.1 hypothetical protein APUTEX25_000074 [Auxenochlorella protothecoides]
MMGVSIASSPWLGPSGLPSSACFRTPRSRCPRPTRHPAVRVKAGLEPKKLTAQDLRRIQEQGPSIQDLTRTLKVVYEPRSGKVVEPLVLTHDFVPPSALTAPVLTPEPDWRRIPEMPFMELFDGLQRRNWTHPRYDPSLPKWELAFFRDTARLLRPVYSGYRVLVQCPAEGRSAWVALDRSGADAFLRDYSGGGLGGAVHNAKRLPQVLVSPTQYGFNQVFEQLFQAFEEEATPAQMHEIFNKGFSPRKGTTYSCPADKQLSVTFHQTLPEYSLGWLFKAIPQYGIYGIALSFLAVVLAVGIFKPRKQMPIDLFMALEFAQSKGKARKDGTTGVGFADVGGIGTAIHDLNDVVAFLKAPLQYAGMKARPPKGILLEGDPGTGKTLVAKAVAGEAGVAFYQMAGSEFVEAIVGVGASRVRDLFKRAMVNAPCIIFVDEIDALGIKRADAGVGTNEEREQTLNQLLTEMDGFSPSLGVMFIGATNRADLLDPALLRAGRFDRRIRINLPDEVGREEILRIHARRTSMDPGVDLAQLAKDLPGLSGAELGNVINESILECLRRRGTTVTQRDVDNGVDRVVQGVRLPPLPKHYAMRRRLALHEAGTGVLSTLLRARSGHVEAVERMSLVGRGRELSRTVLARGRDETYLLVTRARLRDRMRVALAGRAAEHLFLGEASSYCDKDLQDARRIAMRTVTAYCLSDLGLVSYSPPPVPSMENQMFGFEVNPDRIDDNLFGHAVPGGGFQPTDATWNAVCRAASDLILAAYNDNMEELARHEPAVQAVADALLRQETVLGEELEAIMASHPPAAPVREVPRLAHDFDAMGGMVGEFHRYQRLEAAEREARKAGEGRGLGAGELWEEAIRRAPIGAGSGG